MADPSGTTTYGYDNRDRLTSKATPEGTLNYTYDLASNLTVLSTTGLTVNYTYDVLNRLATVAEPNTGTTSYSYDAVGNLASFAAPNGISHGYTYDARNRLTNLAVGTAAGNVASYGYTLDAAGHRTSVTELSGRTVNYTYDNIYRLMSETVSGVAASGAINYTYDAVGNRKTLTSTLAPIQSAASTFDNDDRLSTDGYDPNGNTTQSSGATYTYDFENHLLSTGSVSMVYDGDGNRVSKTVNGVTTTYLVDDHNLTGYPQVVLETTGSETRQFVYGLQRLSQRRVSNAAAEARYFGYDGHDSVRLLTDSTGTVTDSYDYDGFGNLINSTGVTPNEFLFAGEQYDSDLSLYYNRARYLNTSTGRFWNVDSFEGNDGDALSLHKYLYAEGDPIDNLDPSGNEIDEVIGAVAVSMTLDAMPSIQTGTLLTARPLRVGLSIPSGIASQNNFFDSVASSLSDPGKWSRQNTGMSMINYLKTVCNKTGQIGTLTIAGHGWSSHDEQGNYTYPGFGIPGIQVASDRLGYRGLYSDGTLPPAYVRPGETAYVSDLQKSIKSGDVRFAKPCTIQIHACHIDDGFLQSMAYVSGCSVVAAAGACQREGKNWTSGPEMFAAKKYYNGFKKVLPNGSVERLGGTYRPQ